MVLNVNAASVRGTACGNNGNLVTLGGTTLCDGKYSGEVTFTGATAYCLMIVDGVEHPAGCAHTGVVWEQDKVRLVNAGDGGVFLFRDGIVEHLAVDEGDEKEITDRLQDGDIILICSSGLVDVVNDDYLEYFLMTSGSPAEELAEWAMENGSADNVGVIAARIGGGEFGDSVEAPDDDGRFDAWV